MRVSNLSHQPSFVPAPDDGARLSYGMNEDGHLVHVSKAARGLACGLHCAGCHEPLVAKQGLYTVAHFAHHQGRVCQGAAETTLHLLAKEILLEARYILLPEAVASIGGVPEPVSAAIMFRYETAREEVRMDGLIPDVVVGSGERELHVEIYVAHACEPEKLAKLKERNLPSIEIDLSHISRFASREEHTEAVLMSAPRKWLHNRKVAAAEARLRAEAEQQAAADLEKRRRAYAHVAREVAAVWDVRPIAGPESWATAAADAGFGEVICIPIDGDRCFRVATETWQSAFIKHVILDLAGHRVGPDSTLKRLQDFGMLKEPFRLRRDWNQEIVSHIRETLPGFRSPCDALNGYSDFLIDRGIIHPLGGGGWFVPEAVGKTATAMMEAAAAMRDRGRELGRKLQPFVHALGDDGETLIGAWISSALPNSDQAPADLINEGGTTWTELLRRLDVLAPILQPHGPALSERHFIGLPLEGQRRARQAEEEERQLAIGALRKERRRQDAVSFVDSFSRMAVTELGVERGREWIRQALGDTMQDEREDGRFDQGSPIRRDLETALVRECSRVVAVREEDGRRRVMVESAAALARTSRAHLEEFVGRHFADGDRARVWLDGFQRALGMSPRKYCVDGQTLTHCKELLDPRPKRRK